MSQSLRNDVLVSFLALFTLANSAWAEEGPIRATAVITDEKFCLGQSIGGPSLEETPPDAITLRFQVESHYRNDGSKPIIVPTLANPLIVVSRSLRDARLNRNQFIVRPAFGRRSGDLEKRGIDLSTPRKPFFEMIQPGEEAKPWVTEDFALRVHDPSHPQSRTELLGRDIFVQVKFDHSVIPAGLASELELKWLRFGTLWTGTVTTQVLQFRIPSTPKTSVCLSPHRID